MTWSFLFIGALLVGFAMAITTGLARRVLNPQEICGQVVVPAHEHWLELCARGGHFVVAWLLGFGLVGTVSHLLASMKIWEELAIAAVGGLVVGCSVALWIARSAEPCDPSRCVDARGVVTKPIPPDGYGQVEVELGGCKVKLAARSDEETTLAAGEEVSIVDHEESVVVVRRA